MNPRVCSITLLALIVATTGWLASNNLGPAKAQDPNRPQQAGKMRKPSMADTIRANIYADNWFMLYINGQLAAVDSIQFIPHNVISVDLLPTYPMTIAVMARDNADPNN